MNVNPNGSIHIASKNDDRPWMIKSIILHGLVVLLFTTKYLFFPSESITYIPSIKVDMVALPDKVEPKVIPKPAPTPKPAPPAVIKKSKAPPKKAINLKKKADTRKAQDLRNNAIERMKAMERLKEQMKAQEAQTIAKGNRISPGTSMTGLTKLDYNQYIGQLQQHAKNSWSIPKWLSGSNLSADIRVHIDEKGYVVRKELVKSSGDQSFDDSVITAIDNASPFPQPDDKFIDVVRVNGIIFSLRP